MRGASALHRFPMRPARSCDPCDPGGDDAGCRFRRIRSRRVRRAARLRRPVRTAVGRGHAVRQHSRRHRGRRYCWSISPWPSPGPSASEVAPMTVNGWLQIAIFAAIIIALTPPARRLSHARGGGRADLPYAGARSGRARAVSSRRRRSGRGAVVADLCGRHADLQGRGLPAALRHPAAAGPCCRSIRPGRDAIAPELAFNTAVSFLTNTNWQSYGGETTMSYLSQMVGLDGAELHFRRGRHRDRRRFRARLRPAQREDPRQFLGRPGADHALRPAADLRRRSRW